MHGMSAPVLFKTNPKLHWYAVKGDGDWGDALKIQRRIKNNATCNSLELAFEPIYKD